MKQLSDNPKPVSRVKGWKMMHMVCKAFAPRTDLEQYVTNFLARKSAAGPPVEVRDQPALYLGRKFHLVQQQGNKDDKYGI